VKLKIPYVATAVAIASGLVVLFYFFFPSPDGDAFRGYLLQIAVTLAAVALVVGLFNLLSVHLKKVREGSSNAFFSAILIFAMAITFVLGLFLGPNHASTQFAFRYIQVPVEASLMAVLSVSLVYAAGRLLPRRPTLFSYVFLATVLLVLLGISPLASPAMGMLGEVFSGLRTWIAGVPAVAGARGILLGIALGTIATGIRILLGTDRPYGK
jgi:hypothetical protein